MNNTIDARKFQTGNVILIAFSHLIHDIYGSFLAPVLPLLAEKWVKPATENTINTAYQVFREKAIDVEYLTGYEGNAFARTGNIEEDLLSITSVHPMREDAIHAFLIKAHANWSVIENLLHEEKLRELEYRGNTFYMRTLKRYCHCGH